MIHPNTVDEENRILWERYKAHPEAMKDVLILTPANKVAERRATYPDIEVRPIAFSASELKAAHWKFLMGAMGSQSMYMRQINLIMRGLRNNLTLDAIRSGIDNSGLSDHLKELAQTRLLFASEYKQIPRSSRRNPLPMKRINRALLMGHEHLAGALVELMQSRKTPSGADRVLHDAPEAFNGIEVMPTMGREEMEAQLALRVVEGRVELVRPMDAAAIDDHHDLFPGFAEGGHHLMHILAQLLGIKVGHDFIKDFGGAILDRPNDTEQYAAGDTAPGAILQPRLAFEGLLAFALALAQWTRREARALGCAPPARAGQGKTPQDRFVFIEQNDLPAASLVLEGGKFKRTISEVSGGGS